ncbi:E3 SUMO-protein ligase ZBED1-like isoform X2 [Prorops nasuta]|uniref:E3 SUMO-protein ligase ZBED1-like isoform X2 n=1 Tax=Prorops nasuta TaxID=863751 RepID=UPI0034CEFC07
MLKSFLPSFSFNKVPPKSQVWKFFVKTNLGGKCKICQSEVKGSGNTTNLKFHLERLHPDVELTGDVKRNVVASKRKSMYTSDLLNEDGTDDVLSNTSAHSPAHSTTSVASTSSFAEEPTAKQPRIDVTLAKQSSIQDGSKAATITNKLLFMIAKDNMPFKTVEKEGFKLFMKSIIPLYKIPCRQTIINLMEEKYDLLSNIIKTELSQIHHLSLTTDIWTEPLNTKSYIGLTCHHVSNNQHKSITIGVMELIERHTSENIETWLLIVVSDSGANIKRAIKNAFGNKKHLPCFAHSLNLIPSKVIESADVNPIIKKVKAIVTHFKKSVFSADKLRACSDLKLLQSVETRWNSTHDMLQRFVELSDIIGGILLQNPTAPTMITAAELQIIKEFVHLLKPFVEATKIISGEYYLTASKVIPVVSTLRVALYESEPETEEGIKMKELLLEQFEQRFNTIENEIILTTCTILDPRFKSIHVKNDQACSIAISEIAKNINKRNLDQEPVQNNASNINVKNDFWSYHNDLINKLKSQVSPNEDEIPDELRYYLAQPPIEMISCPITFWKSNNTSLAEIGKKYLAVIATSVPCERIFSKAGRIMTESRNRLTANHLQQSLFLGSLSREDWRL